MARQERNDVDYFPFLCKESKAMYYIETTYGNDGFATWVKILRELAVTNYHHLILSDNVAMMYLASKCKIDTDLLKKIIHDLCELGEFDKELWDKKSVIWCQKLIDSIQDAYKKRKNECISRSILYSRLGLRNSPKSIPNEGKSVLNGGSYPQTKLKKSKEEDSKEDDGDKFDLIENLKSKYLENEKLITAVLSVKKNKLKNKDELSNRLTQFNSELMSKNIFQKSWNDYTSHFLNWHRKTADQNNNANQQSGQKIPIG